MSRKLSTRSSLDILRKEAKRWLKALQAGDDAAQQRLLAALPSAASDPSLRDVQLALAREYGLPGWTALHLAIEDLRRSHAERVEMILRSADWSADHATGARLVTRWPETGRDNLYTAVATGNLAEVQRRLAADPAAANRKGGPLEREPILYLGHSRLPGSESHGTEIVRLLLDHGADPNAHWIGPWGEPAFTVLTALIGEGRATRHHTLTRAPSSRSLSSAAPIPSTRRRSTIPRSPATTPTGWASSGRNPKPKTGSMPGARPAPSAAGSSSVPLIICLATPQPTTICGGPNGSSATAPIPMARTPIPNAPCARKP